MNLRLGMVAALAVALFTGCGPGTAVELWMGNAIFDSTEFVAFAMTGEDLEMSTGLQGADMVRPSVRIDGVDDTSMGRVRLSLFVDGEAITGATEQLRDLIDDGDGYLYHYQMFLPFPGVWSIPDLIDRPAILRGEVLGGYDAFVEIDVTLVDNKMENF